MLYIILAAGGGLIGGGLIGFLVRHGKALAEIKVLQDKENGIVAKAKRDAQEIKYNARKESKKIIREEREELEREIRYKKDSIREQENHLKSKDQKLEQKVLERERQIQELKEKEKGLEEQKGHLNEEIEEYRGLKSKAVDKLSQVSSMTKDEAKKELMDHMVEDAKVDGAKLIRRVEEETREEAEKKAKRIVAIAIQRFAGEYVAESTVTTVDLPSDDIKGRLIGREGRNIRAFEQICGVDLIIDDTPEVVVISSFNVVRREVAKMTIQKLIADGRIHPAKIEEFFEKSRSEMDVKLRELGEKAQMEIGIHGIHPEILKLIGALNWRTSYTQNQYQHALEAAFICGAMASELGQNVKQARRAGLMHDIGKVLDAAAEGSHAVIGADFARKYGESPDIVHAIRAHHDDEKPQSVLAHIVAAADALSGARPGARKAMMESYVSRLTDIENIANSFKGVTKTYAISAGREMRVLVENDKVSDEETVMLSRDIAKKIEEEMSYPGTIKVTVIREIRAVGVAK